MAVKERKTGEDINANLTLIIGSVPDISVLPQILVTFYYIKDRKAVAFSHHARVPSEPGLVAEAAAEGRTIRTITLAGNVLEMSIPKEDTDDLVLSVCEEVVVYAEVAYFDAAGKKRKTTGPDDENRDKLESSCDVTVFKMIKSSTVGLI